MTKKKRRLVLLLKNKVKKLRDISNVASLFANL